ncbi:MAG: TerB family tellurite resistance protein [Sandaracinaceae bacterium]|nr:TerB family tellurite resistance protein [Sandaracinaceae bacterium]
MNELSKQDRLRLMKFVCSFAWADLRIDDSERTMVRKMVRKLKLDNDEKRQVEEWLELPPSAEELDPAQIPDEHRALFLKTAREVIEVDGDVAPEEIENFELLAQLLA